ncbi:helix-turn-helix domain-containing protein [Stutzerimonas nitrititolerans]|uniref:helix-turn-helix domain-containing protein n=1 Tax=Stutzerimonas nitrititolerans TaxID=2482751 RepID=UPI0028AB6C35|nr:type II toxin-antitoxin system MqsA family antitoxin [Stutzerimonas nitrititolerans]
MDKEIEQFQADLLASVGDMNAGKAARATTVKLSPVAEVRAKVRLAQSEFAKLLGVSVHTLQDWEQGRRTPSGAAQTLMKVARRHPETLRKLIQA